MEFHFVKAEKFNNVWNESLLVDNKVSKNKSFCWMEGEEQSLSGNKSLM